MTLSKYCAGLSLAAVVLSLNSCESDKLENGFENFYGSYTWEHTYYSKNWWDSRLYFRSADEANYSANIEISEDGFIYYYIDQQEVHKTRFKVLNQDYDAPSDTYWLELDPSKEDSKNMDLNNSMSFTLIGNDTLTSIDFPGEAYDESNHGNHFFIRD